MLRFAVSDSINFKNCKSLEGIAEFKINKFTITDFRKIHKTIQANLESYLQNELKSDFSNGFTNIYYTDTLNSILEIETSIRQYKLGGFGGKYKIGNIELNNLYLLFYNDTLIGIQMTDVPDVIKEAFIAKYGEGKGYHKDNSIHYKDHRKSIISVKEVRLWENNFILAEYEYELESHPKLLGKESLIIRDKTGNFEQYEKDVQVIVSRLFQEQKEARQRSIDMI